MATAIITAFSNLQWLLDLQTTAIHASPTDLTVDNILIEAFLITGAPTFESEVLNGNHGQTIPPSGTSEAYLDTSKDAANNATTLAPREKPALKTKKSGTKRRQLQAKKSICVG